MSTLYHPLPGELVRDSLETRDEAGAELLRKHVDLLCERIKIEQALMEPRFQASTRMRSGCRLNETPFAERLDSPATLFRYWNEVITKMPWSIPDREVCVAVTVNTRHRVTGHSLVSIGSLGESIVHPREVFRAAVAMNAYAVLLLAHDHPSGDPSPSEADYRIARRLLEAGNIPQIQLLDRVMVGENRWFSFKEAGGI